MKVYHVTSSLASAIKDSYSQNDHCRLLLDHFGGRKVSLPSHLKARLNRFSYSDGLLWHQLSPCDPLRIYVPHDTDLKLMILHEHHDAGIWAVKSHSYECQRNFGGHIYIDEWPTIFALANSVSVLSLHRPAVRH